MSRSRVIDTLKLQHLVMEKIIIGIVEQANSWERVCLQKQCQTQVVQGSHDDDRELLYARLCIVS